MKAWEVVKAWEAMRSGFRGAGIPSERLLAMADGKSCESERLAARRLLPHTVTGSNREPEGPMISRL